jgi:dihydrofolate synthase/folylpolyglutamate synthase
MLQAGECTDLIILYGSVSDKDVDAVMRLMPRNAKYVFTQANGKRALSAETVREKYLAFCTEDGRQPGTVWCCPDVGEAARVAYDEAECLCKTDPSARPLIYVGGSTYVVSEFISQMC